MGRPKSVQPAVEKEIDKVSAQFDDFDSQVKAMTLDRLNEAPKTEVEPQTKLSQRELDRASPFYLKPKRSIGGRDKFNEKYRNEYNFAKEYVHFTAENKEIIGDNIEIWTRPYGGIPAEFWEVPVNKPVWGPRYLAEQIKRKFYHRLTMNESVVTGRDGIGTSYGSMVVDTTVQRLDATPVASSRSVFMGAYDVKGVTHEKAV